MTDSDRLIGAFEEFKRWESREHEHIRMDLMDIKNKVDSLRLWRSSVIGMASMLGALFGWVAGYINK